MVLPTLTDSDWFAQASGGIWTMIKLKKQAVRLVPALSVVAAVVAAGAPVKWW